MFQGGFDRAAAETVAGASLRLLSRLVDKSLVMRIGPDRYKLHELLRQFSAEQLKASPEEYTRTLDRHCQYYGTLMRTYEESFKVNASTIVSSLNRLRQDYDNILVGWYRAIEQPLIDQIRQYFLGMCMLFVQRGVFTTGVQTFQQAMRHIDIYQDRISAADRLLGLTLCGMLFDTISEHEQAKELFQEALILNQVRPEVAQTDPALLGLLLNFASWNAIMTDDISQARALQENSLSLSHKAHFEFGIWQTRVMQGMIEFAAGNYQAAWRAYDESLQWAHHIKEISAIVCSSALVASAHAILNDAMRARDFLQQTLDMSHEFWVADALCTTLTTIALLHQYYGQPDTALNMLAMLYHHPQCGGHSRIQLKLLLTHYKTKLSSEQVDTALEKASKGQLSTPILEPDFVIDPAFIDHLLLALNQFPIAQQDEQA